MRSHSARLRWLPELSMCLPLVNVTSLELHCIPKVRCEMHVHRLDKNFEVFRFFVTEFKTLHLSSVVRTFGQASLPARGQLAAATDGPRHAEADACGRRSAC